MNNQVLKMSDNILDAAEIIWNYMKLNHQIKPVDIIFVLGSRDDRVATYAATLYKDGLAPCIVVSGGVSHKNDLLKTSWGQKTEADHFASILIQQNVPAERMLVESNAKNTGENILFTHSLLSEKNIYPKSIILVQKPYMERRTYATFMKQWPGAEDIEVMVASPNHTFDEYISADQPVETVISIMVGDLQRIIEYPKLGYQIYQKVPQTVLDSYDYLAQHGYNKHLLQQ